MLVNSIEIGNEDSSPIQKLYSDVTLTAVAAVRIGKRAYRILRLWLLWVHNRKRGKETDIKVRYYVEKAV